MQVEVKIDELYKELKVIVLADKMSEEVSNLVRKISEESPQTIVGFRDKTVELLKQDDIINIYAEGSRVLATTDRGEYQLRFRLYEIESRLNNKDFMLSRPL